MIKKRNHVFVFTIIATLLLGLYLGPLAQITSADALTSASDTIETSLPSTEAIHTVVFRNPTALTGTGASGNDEIRVARRDNGRNQTSVPVENFRAKQVYQRDCGGADTHLYQPCNSVVLAEKTEDAREKCGIERRPGTLTQ